MPGDHSAWESGPPRLLSIRELAERTGVATTALRYYDEPALVRPAARSSGRRRHHAPSAVTDVGVILFFRGVGFSLAEIRSFMTGDRESRRELVDRGVGPADRAAAPPRRGPHRARTRAAMPCRRAPAVLTVPVGRRRTAARPLPGRESRAGALTLHRRASTAELRFDDLPGHALPNGPSVEPATARSARSERSTRAVPRGSFNGQLVRPSHDPPPAVGRYGAALSIRRALGGRRSRPADAWAHAPSMRPRPVRRALRAGSARVARAPRDTRRNAGW